MPSLVSVKASLLDCQSDWLMELLSVRCLAYRSALSLERHWEHQSGRSWDSQLVYPKELQSVQRLVSKSDWLLGYQSVCLSALW